MRTAATNFVTKNRFTPANDAPRSGSTNLAAAATRGALILAVFLVLLVAAQPALAQTETVLYNFPAAAISTTGGSTARLTFYGSKIYGTTFGGGVGYGSVFELSPNSSGGWNATTLYNFTGGADGAYPSFSYVMFDGGNIYGTASNGGAHGYGVVFELSRTGGIWTETVLFNFPGGQHNSSPANGLIKDRAGNLYGTCGGGKGGGVFELTPSGSGWSEKLIFTDALGNDAGLTMDAAGNIFGIGGITYPNTAVFELSPNGTGGWKRTVIHSFTLPEGALSLNGTLVLDGGGNIYGTTGYGGAQNLGTVFKLSPVKGKPGKWTYADLYDFTGSPDGAGPFAGVVLNNGNIYGTTNSGGTYSLGTVFELAAAGKGSYAEKVLWNFNGTDGLTPYGGVILHKTGVFDLYGATVTGGANGEGVVFEVIP
jgi:uncharacterized repeat protein (TIGR03803 family)